MSRSADAILFYGYCWKEECTLLDGDGDWQERIATKRGHINPFDAAPDWSRLGRNERLTAKDEWFAAHKPELDAWLALEKAIGDEFGVDIDYHCYSDLNRPYVYLKTSRVTASWEEEKVINPATLTVLPEWSASLDTFLAELGIAKPDGQDMPQWWLVSYYG